ncbi:MAG TPA: asparagine synthase-related protein [Ignavibacteria bacterium]|nr:asparagine synthase-related protein [Ignavibacteria bacterium]
MCGIIGFIGVGSKSILEECTDLLQHRGPDDRGVEWFDEWNSGFGHRRLSIIDLSSAGHQPMSTEDGRYWITYNGEVYNYKMIREELGLLKRSNGTETPLFNFKSGSDTEVVLYAYAAWGEKALDKLNGMFAFAVFDTLTGEVFIARDRLGIKPIYFAEVEGGLVFASEAKAILKSGLADVKPDIYALESPMHYQVAPLTGFDGIYKLEAAHYLKYKLKRIPPNGKKNEANFQADASLSGKGDSARSVQTGEGGSQHYQTGAEIVTDSYVIDKQSPKPKASGALEIFRWWKLNVTENNAKSEKELIDELDALLNDAVKLQMVSDVPVGIFLSGGLDSSLIAALMRKHYKGVINAFTIKFSKEDQKFEKLEDDSVWAKQVADMFEFNYEEMIVKPETEKLLPRMVYHLDEPIADPAALNTYLISKFARQNKIYVLLNGMGGDEVFAGYRKHLACLKADVYTKFVPALARKAVESFFRKRRVADSRKGYKFARWIKRFLSFASYDRFERFLLSDIGLNINDYNEVFSNSEGYRNSFYYLKEKKFYDEIDASYLTKMCYNDTNTFMISHNLAYSDKASMMASVETRPPLIDHRIVEFMFSLPPKFRIKGNRQKYLLKKVAERYLPKKVVNRPKAPFGSPLRSWIRGALAKDIDRMLSLENLKRKDFLKAEKIRDIVLRDRSGKEDLAHVIYRFFVMMTWWETFFSDFFT